MEAGEVKVFQGEFTQTGRLWRRAVADIADAFILFLPALIIIFLGYFFVVSGGEFKHIFQKPGPEHIKEAITVQVILELVFLTYFTYFIGKSGQSPGKKSMGLKVVNLDGEVIGYGKAFIRCLIISIYSLRKIGALIFIISIILAIADKQKRTLHDRICKTSVVGKGIEPVIEKICQEGKKRISGPAIFGFILSIFCVIIPILGQLICFYVCGRALYDIKQSNGLLKGKFWAILGLSISAVLLIGFIILFLFVIPHSK